MIWHSTSDRRGSKVTGVQSKRGLWHQGVASASNFPGGRWGATESSMHLANMAVWRNGLRSAAHWLVERSMENKRGQWTWVSGAKMSTERVYGTQGPLRSPMFPWTPSLIQLDRRFAFLALWRYYSPADNRCVQRPLGLELRAMEW